MLVHGPAFCQAESHKRLPGIPNNQKEFAP
jgi:hypothetical protein